MVTGVIYGVVTNIYGDNECSRFNVTNVTNIVTKIKPP